MSKRHEQRTAGRPLTGRRRPLKASDVETEPGDMSVIDAAQTIYALHNEDPGANRGYILYDPFQPRRHGGRRLSEYRRIGYVAIAAGKELRRDPLIFENVVRKIERARIERSDPNSGKIHV